MLVADFARYWMILNDCTILHWSRWSFHSFSSVLLRGTRRDPSGRFLTNHMQSLLCALLIIDVFSEVTPPLVADFLLCWLQFSFPIVYS